jgi:transcriptional regulator with XRE-family HTH domain
MDTMGERIQSARIELGLSQNKLALAAKVPQSSLSAAERGLRGLKAWDLSRIAKVLNCTVAWLQTGVDESPLCAEVATIPVKEIQGLILTARRVGDLRFAEVVEAWLKQSVGDSIPW